MSEYIIKNKTIKNIVLLIDGKTFCLSPKGDSFNRDVLIVKELNDQLKNLKNLKLIQITKKES